MGGAGAGATRPPESISSIIAESGRGGGESAMSYIIIDKLLQSNDNEKV